jgi:hypothetical protein
MDALGLYPIRFGLGTGVANNLNVNVICFAGGRTAFIVTYVVPIVAVFFGVILTIADRWRRHMSTWRRLQRGWPASYPLAQFPNAPLLLALAASVASSVLDGNAADYAGAVFYIGLSAWAWLELADGTNAFRRMLGAAGLVYVALRLGAALAG